MCHVSNQIAIHCDEPEEVECPVCSSLMTEEKCGRYEFLKCDNSLCAETIKLEEGL